MHWFHRDTTTLVHRLQLETHEFLGGIGGKQLSVWHCGWLIHMTLQHPVSQPMAARERAWFCSLDKSSSAVSGLLEVIVVNRDPYPNPCRRSTAIHLSCPCSGLCLKWGWECQWARWMVVDDMTTTCSMEKAWHQIFGLGLTQLRKSCPASWNQVFLEQSLA